MADDSGINVRDLTDIQDALSDLAQEIGPNLPDSAPFSRALRDVFRAYNPIQRALDLAELRADMIIPNGDVMTRYGRLCCTNRLAAGLPLLPDRLIPRPS